MELTSLIQIFGDLRLSRVDQSIRMAALNLNFSNFFFSFRVTSAIHLCIYATISTNATVCTVRIAPLSTQLADWRTCSMTSFKGFPTFCSTVSANENSGADCCCCCCCGCDCCCWAVSLFVVAADVALSVAFILVSFLLFCSFSPIWPLVGRTRNWFVKTTCRITTEIPKWIK